MAQHGEARSLQPHGSLRPKHIARIGGPDLDRYGDDGGGSQFRYRLVRRASFHQPLDLPGSADDGDALRAGDEAYPPWARSPAVAVPQSAEIGAGSCLRRLAE